MIQKIMAIILCLCAFSVSAAPVKGQNIGAAWVYAVPGKTYDQVRDDLVAAIEERGMMVSAVSHVKDMLDRTQSDLGYQASVYATGGETLLFCKADLSHKIMRDDPHNIALCPYGISIYTLASEQNKVFLSYRQPPKLAVYQPIHQLLQDIIQAVAE